MEQELKDLVRNAEERYIWYKNEIENVGRNRTIFDPKDELVIWYKAHLREMKNAADTWLAKVREELRDHRQGLNPAFCYFLKKVSTT